MATSDDKPKSLRVILLDKCRAPDENGLQWHLIVPFFKGLERKRWFTGSTPRWTTADWRSTAGASSIIYMSVENQTLILMRSHVQGI